MAIIQCSQCQKNISDKAKRCPHCGASLTSTGNNILNESVQQGKTPQKKSKFLKRLLIVILIISIIFILIYAIFIAPRYAFSVKYAKEYLSYGNYDSAMEEMLPYFDKEDPNFPDKYNTIYNIGKYSVSNDLKELVEGYLLIEKYCKTEYPNLDFEKDDYLSFLKETTMLNLLKLGFTNDDFEKINNAKDEEVAAVIKRIVDSINGISQESLKVAEQIKAADSKPIESANKISGLITLGSSAEDVKRIMGTPDQIYDGLNNWTYGYDSIYFDEEEKVNGWSNISGSLKVNIGEVTKAGAAIKLGLSKNEVVSIMGTPDQIYDGLNNWTYGYDSISFDSEGKVDGWSNISGEMKIE